MEYLVLGFFTGISLILAIGAQNIFVIEQGLKKQHLFIVCLICSLSDLILIFFGIFLFHYFNQYFYVHFISKQDGLSSLGTTLVKTIPWKVTNLVLRGGGAFRALSTLSI